MSTKIEWTDETWNPLLGCEAVSPGCDRCYAAREASGRLKHHELYEGLAVAGKFTGQVRLVPERLDQPLRWTKPRRIFVNSMSDLFHKDVPDDFIARVWAVMAATPRHHYQLLTKRHGRMRSLLRSHDFAREVGYQLTAHVDELAVIPDTWPLPNVWLGVSVEDQERADLRIPALLATPAAVRFLSCEPLLGPITFGTTLLGAIARRTESGEVWAAPAIGWVIVGGESGPGARPMHPEWARQLRDECVAAGVPYLFKQWGEWSPNARNTQMSRTRFTYESIRFQPDGTRYRADQPDGYSAPGMESLLRVGKKAAGRVLDGRTWDEYPDTTPTPVAS